jgi:uncharacterized protein (UPF0333 family)
MNSLIARYHPRTLWLQTLLLLIGSVTVASIVTGPVLLSSFENVALTEMEKKGKATVQTLAKDYELRLAISLRDAGQADPILRSLSATDDDIRYVAITKGREVISVAPAQIGKDEIVSHLDQFFAGAQAQSARSEIRRFTQVIMSQKSAFEGDPLLGGEVSKPKEEPGFVVLGLYSKRTQSKVSAADRSQRGRRVAVSVHGRHLAVPALGGGADGSDGELCQGGGRRTAAAATR